MHSKRSGVVVTAALCLGILGHSAWGTENRETIAKKMGQRALTFEQNRGQADSEAKFIARAKGYTIFATGREIVLSLKSAGNAPGGVVRLSWEGADSQPEPQAVGPEAGVVNYLIGRESEWHTGIPAYSKIAYRSVFRGTNLVLYGNQKNLEFDFNVAPGADPARIAFNVSGVERLSVAQNGDLILRFKNGELCQHRPVIYQSNSSGEREPVAGDFKLLGNNKVGFRLGAYDRTRELVIDPTLVYSTYLGGLGDDEVLGVAVDASNRVYATGFTRSTDFPKKNARDSSLGGGQDAFITKFNATGNGLLYSTYLGGSGSDFGNAIAVDRDGYAYVTGLTSSTNFPGSVIGPLSSGGAGFAVRLSPTGSTLTYARRFSGSQTATAAAIALDASHNAYVIGTTDSHDFPTTTGVVQRSTTGDIATFVMKLSPGGNPVYSTYIGNATQTNGFGIVVDTAGNAYAAGSVWFGGIPTTPGSFMPDPPEKDVPCGICRVMTGWIVKLNSTATKVLYGTYLGGNDFDEILGIAIDGSRNVYVTGDTASTTFPTTSGAKQRTNRGNGDAFVSKLNASGSALVYSTYLGGSGSEVGWSIAVNSAGHAFVAGVTSSTNFPQVSPIKPGYNGGGDAFVSKLWATGGGFHYSTYIGGTDTDIGRSVRLDGSGNAYVGGITNSNNFPTKSAFRATKSFSDEDGFVLKLH